MILTGLKHFCLWVILGAVVSSHMIEEEISNVDSKSPGGMLDMKILERAKRQVIPAELTPISLGKDQWGIEAGKITQLIKDLLLEILKILGAIFPAQVPGLQECAGTIKDLPSKFDSSAVFALLNSKGNGNIVSAIASMLG